MVAESQAQWQGDTPRAVARAAGTCLEQRMEIPILTTLQMWGKIPRNIPSSACPFHLWETPASLLKGHGIVHPPKMVSKQSRTFFLHFITWFLSLPLFCQQTVVKYYGMVLATCGVSETSFWLPKFCFTHQNSQHSTPSTVHQGWRTHGFNLPWQTFSTIVVYWGEEKTNDRYFLCFFLGGG